MSTAPSRMVQLEEMRWKPSLIEHAGILTMSDEDLIVHAVCEADAYREILRTALTELHRCRKTGARLREAHHRLIDEYRRLKERIRQEAA